MQEIYKRDPRLITRSLRVVSPLRCFTRECHGGQATLAISGASIHSYQIKGLSVQVGLTILSVALSLGGQVIYEPNRQCETLQSKSRYEVHPRFTPCAPDIVSPPQ